MRRNFIITAFVLQALISCFYGKAQTTKRVLFIGNSYIYTNDMPAILEEIALNMGDTLIYEQSTPGGYSFASHLGNTTTTSKIEAGGWDYVILQEQSQIPSFPIEQVEEDCFPFAEDLCELIRLNNPCAEIVFFMTWGRENGDSQNCVNWPPVCTYEGMDDLLRERYMMMADQNDALVGAVGAVWRHIRENNSDIELYSPDQSHPSLTGSYAAAVCFYTSIFRRDPEDIMYNEGVGEGDASYIRSAVKTVVYDNMEEWSIGVYDPAASLQWQELNDLAYQFTNTSQNFETAQISFQGSEWENWSGASIDYTYAEAGLYSVGVIATSCGISDTTFYEIQVGSVDIMENEIPILIYPNPARDILKISNSASILDFERIEIFNAAGTLTHSFKTKNQQSIEIPILDLAEGVYSVSIKTNKGNIRKRIVVVR